MRDLLIATDKNDSRDGIILLAKQSGITSFSSLWQIKNALGTKKIGHTGTLDTFAEGLLVALSGRLTKLVSYITDCDKEYQALIVFGRETDTLDPDGETVKTSPLPTLESVLAILPTFEGSIQQQPPMYSAIHIAGQRASDRIRNGEAITLPYRTVTINKINILDIHSRPYDEANSTPVVSSIILGITCSKGTYIRSLARDIAYACTSCAHLGALRRMRIGPFHIEQAAGFSMLHPFGSVAPSVYGKGDKPPQVSEQEIRSSVLPFLTSVAPVIGLETVILHPRYENDFMNGKSVCDSWFISIGSDPARKKAVFSENRFIGVVNTAGKTLSYEFVIGREP